MIPSIRPLAPSQGSSESDILYSNASVLITLCIHLSFLLYIPSLHVMNQDTDNCLFLPIVPE